jgi:hypothetical protein
MVRPTLSRPIHRSQPVQTSTGVGFEIIHVFLGPNLGLRDTVHMIRPHMRSQQTPTAV